MQKMTRRNRTALRFAMGCECGTEQDFLHARDTHFAAITAISPLKLDSSDNISVWAGFDTTLTWLLTLEHVLAALPAEKDRDVLVTILTNDGTPQHGRLSNRSCHRCARVRVCAPRVCVCVCGVCVRVTLFALMQYAYAH